MDDESTTYPSPPWALTRPTTPVSFWLTFSLAFADSTRLCRHIRQTVPDPATLGIVIENFLRRQDDQLGQLLRELCSEEQIQQLFSDATARKCDQALAWLRQNNCHHLIPLDDPIYPAQLRDTSDSPPVLYAKGDPAALNYPLLAVVGSRKASHAALRLTHSLCHQLAETGLGIVSGLAVGVDAAAHQGALQASHRWRGPTLAVAATPIDKVYPRHHTSLVERIVDNAGLIVSEYPLGSTTRPWHFPRRNRIISGISLGVLVIEAGLPSGTLTTANHAINQGREVMAVPGSVHNLQAQGCHALIKQGAALVENVQDVVDVLSVPLRRAHDALQERHVGQPATTSLNATATTTGPDAHPTPLPDYQSSCAQARDIELSQAEIALLHTLQAQSATLDELVTQTPMTLPQLSALLGLLETRGLITITSGGRYACLK